MTTMESAGGGVIPASTRANKRLPDFHEFQKRHVMDFQKREFTDHETIRSISSFSMSDDDSDGNTSSLGRRADDALRKLDLEYESADDSELNKLTMFTPGAVENMKIHS